MYQDALDPVKILRAKGLVRSQQSVTGANPEPHWNVLDPDVLGWLLERRPSTKRLLQFAQFLLAIEPSAASLAARAAGDLERAANSTRGHSIR